MVVWTKEEIYVHLGSTERAPTFWSTPAEKA